MTMIADLLLERPDRAAEEVQTCLIRFGLAVVPMVLPPGADLVAQVRDVVVSFLQMPLGNLTLTAWDMHRSIRTARQETKGQPGVQRRVVIAHHTLTSTHKPSVRLDVGGQTVPVLELEMTFSLAIASIVVAVEEGQVVGTDPATASSSAVLAATRPTGGAPVVLWKKQSPQIQLSPYLRFGTAHPTWKGLSSTRSAEYEDAPSRYGT